MPTFHVLLNGAAGSTTDTSVQEVEAAFARYQASAQITTVAGDLAEAAREATRDPNCRVLVAMGGDGTVAAVAAVAMETHKTLGIIPGGTLNHFARDLNLPSDLTEAIKLIITGKPQPVDIVRLNDTVVLNTISIGVYPQLVRRREQTQKRIGKGPALVLELVRTMFRRPQRSRYTITYDDTTKSLKTPFIFIGNNDYHTAEGAIGERTSLTDGYMSLLIYQQASWLRLSWELIKAFRGRPTHWSLIQASPRKVIIRGPRSRAEVAHDGEVGIFRLPLTVRLEPAKLTVIGTPSLDLFLD
jgi:diacylglycerol kinase family enzyme